MIKSIAIHSIKAYRKFISPYKGWKCAHAHIYGGHSCSDYGLVVIEEQGVLQGVSLLRERFKECSSASVIYKKHRASISLASGSNFMDIPPELFDLISVGGSEIGHEAGDCIGDCCKGIFD